MLQHIQSKIHTWDNIGQTINRWHFQSNKVVFTNGCFDLLHYGHIHYLAEAKALGDRLVIGLNSQASVRRLKGAHRPINDEQTRLFLLASLQYIDAVITFDQDTPYELIQLIQPDILVKGGDWAVEQIVGADIVLNKGGTVKSLPFIDGYSTTNIETKIRSW